MKAWDEAVFRWINGWPDGWTPLFYTFSQEIGRASCRERV